MSMNRRQFLILTAGTAAIAATDGLGMADNGAGSLIDAGPVSSFAAEGVYSNFRALGFFVIRKGGQLSALSAYCTHRKTQLTAERDCTFYCRRHGSTFDPSGHVTKAPAKLDLPVLATSVNEAGHLLVCVPAI